MAVQEINQPAEVRGSYGHEPMGAASLGTVQLQTITRLMRRVPARKCYEVAAVVHQIGLREQIWNGTFDAHVFHRFAGIGTYASGAKNGECHGSAGRQDSQRGLQIDDASEPLHQLLVV